jgi:serine/threonine protein kinase
MHRDITLANILLDRNLAPKLADFGLAARLSAQSLEGSWADDAGAGGNAQAHRHAATDMHRTLCGTANFISPEVAQRSEHGLATDLWALGCVLFTLLTGTPPFQQSGPHAVERTLQHVVTTPVDIPSSLSASCADLLRGLLHKDARHRTTLAQAMTHAFFTAGPAVIPPISLERSNDTSGLSKKPTALSTLSPSSRAPSVGETTAFSSPRFSGLTFASTITAASTLHTPRMLDMSSSLPPLNLARLQPIAHVTRRVTVEITLRPSVRFSENSKTTATVGGTGEVLEMMDGESILHVYDTANNVQVRMAGNGVFNCC